MAGGGCKAPMLDLPLDLVPTISSRLRLRELLSFARVSVDVRSVISQDAQCWERAMEDLDPCYQLGPEEAHAAASLLPTGWLGLCVLLMREGGGWVSPLGTLVPRRRSSRSADTKVLGSMERPLLLGTSTEQARPIPNLFMFKPTTRTVRTVDEFEAAMRMAAPFDTIEIAADLTFHEYHNSFMLRDNVRLVGAPIDQGNHAGQILDHPYFDTYVRFAVHRHVLHLPYDSFSVVSHAAAIINLTIHTGSLGDTENPWDVSHCFPCLEVTRGNVIVESCNIFAEQGTAVMIGYDRHELAARFSAAIHMRNCAIATPLLCFVPKYSATLTVRESELGPYWWAAHLGHDASGTTKAEFLATNTLEPGVHTEDTFHDAYEYVGQKICPWRPGWSMEMGRRP